MEDKPTKDNDHAILRDQYQLSCPLQQKPKTTKDKCKVKYHNCEKGDIMLENGSR